MVSLQEQMQTLQSIAPTEKTQDWKPYNPNPEADQSNPFAGGLEEKASEYDRSDAMQLAATLGITDTFRGVKQIAGFDKVDMAVDQKLLNKLMEHPEWGDDIKWTYFGSLLLDPIGWLTPASKAAQLAKAGYKFTKWQKARKLAVSGFAWGGIGGVTGYVDPDSGGRVFNTITGAAGGAVLAPALGIPAQALGKFIASKTPKQLTDDPQGMIKELTGIDTASLTNPVKSFYYKNFQPAAQKYEDLKRQYVYKPIVLDNPIASVGAGAGAYGGNLVFGDDIDKYINRLEDERDMDSGPWRSALKTTLMFGGAALGFGLFKKRFKGKNAQDFIGRRVIDNYKLSDEVVKLKEGAYLDFNDAAYKFTDIAERAKALSEDEKKILYYFLDGQVDNIADLSKEAREIGAEAREIIQETGQRMVDAGMLKPSTFHENMNSYIHRTYGEKLSPKLLKEIGIDVDDPILKGEGKLKIIGSELKGRGHIKDIPVKEKNNIAKLEKLGYKKFGKQNNGIQSYRIQLTAEQRKALNEIEDAAFAIKATGDLMLNDLAAYKFYRDINISSAYADASELKRLYKLSTNKKASADERAFASKLYKEYKDGGRKTYDELTPTEQADLVQIPVSKVPKTGLQKYGDLAGRWLPKDIADDIIVARKFSDGEGFLGELYNNKYFQKYRRFNSMWKRSKTSWNPTVHTNNIVSNFFLLDAHDVPLDTFIENGFKVYTKKGQEELNKLDLGFGESNTYEDLVRLGVFDAGLAKAELKIGNADWKTEYLKDFHGLELRKRIRGKGGGIHRGKFEEDALGEVDDILEMSINIAGRNYQKYVDWIKKKNPIKALDKLATGLYQREDQMFRVALYIDRVQKRMPELNQFTKGSAEYTNAIEQIKRSAAKEAKKGFIDYNIQSPVINILRDSALPFFSYTYRIIPILAKTATLKPSKFAKWAAIGYALDYAGRERSKEETQYERALMDEKRLSRMFGLPFMPPTFIKLGDPLRSAEQFAQKRFDYALGWGLDRDVEGNKLPQRSNFLDTTRFLPGADLLGQTTPDEGGFISGLPAPFQPSGGLAGELFVPLLTGKDPFTGKDIPKDVNALEFTLARLVPNNPLFGISGLQKLFGSKERNDFYDAWAHKKIMNALERRPDSSAYAPDLPVLTAVAQTIGIKIWPIDPQKLNAVFTAKYRSDIRELEELIDDRRDKVGKYRGTDLYEAKQRDLNIYAEEIKEKMEDILINARIVDAKRFKRRERKFGEVPADIIESMGESISETAREIFD
tara:strand:+ start:793 stop:4581 length:3789 start_codon:yes stop_codon:yes gene_type:complete